MLNLGAFVGRTATARQAELLFRSSSSSRRSLGPVIFFSFSSFFSLSLSLSLSSITRLVQIFLIHNRSMIFGLWFACSKAVSPISLVAHRPTNEQSHKHTSTQSHKHDCTKIKKQETRKHTLPAGSKQTLASNNLLCKALQEQLAHLWNVGIGHFSPGV